MPSYYDVIEFFKVAVPAVCMFYYISTVSIAIRLRAGPSELRIPVGARNLTPSFQSGCGVPQPPK